MSRHYLSPRLVPGTGWESFAGPDRAKSGEGGVYLEPNQSYQCFSIRALSEDGTEDLIHFCDWRALVAAIEEFMTERERLAAEDGDW